jgi:hypothetical protein
MKRSLKMFSQMPAYFEPLQIDLDENHLIIFNAVGKKSDEFDLYKVSVLNIASGS